MATFYEKPELEIISLHTEDVLSTSGLEENETDMMPTG